MFDLNWLQRSTTREQYLKIRAALKKTGGCRDWQDHATSADRLAARVDLQRELDAATVNGKIGIIDSGMDCDCAQYCHVSRRDAMSVIAYEVYAKRAYAGAEGPMLISMCRPDELPESWSRDLAAEAYENGHPHVVYYND